MIAIIDYKAGNIASVKNALSKLGRKVIVTADPHKVLSADGVVFPGQGRAGAAMKELRKSGLDKTIAKIKTPFLGICLGMQLLAVSSDEDNTECLGIFENSCRKFPSNLKAPHLGWNRVKLIRKSPLSEGVSNGAYFYFVHSYYMDASLVQTVGTTSYGFDFASIMQKDNFFAVQFHPEKSGVQGLNLFNNFCKLCL